MHRVVRHIHYRTTILPSMLQQALIATTVLVGVYGICLGSGILRNTEYRMQMSVTDDFIFLSAATLCLVANVALAVRED